MNAPEPGRGVPLGSRKTVPPAHVWCATERKFFFEKLPCAKVVSSTPPIAPPQAPRFCAADDDNQHISVQGATLVPYMPCRIAGCTCAVIVPTRNEYISFKKPPRHALKQAVSSPPVRLD